MDNKKKTIQTLHGKCKVFANWCQGWRISPGHQVPALKDFQGGGCQPVVSRYYPKTVD